MNRKVGLSCRSARRRGSAALPRSWPRLAARVSLALPMSCPAPPEKDHVSAALGKRHRRAADPFRPNSGLKSQEYPAPVLGLIFRFCAEVRFDFVLGNPPVNGHAVDVANCGLRRPSCEVRSVRQSRLAIRRSRRLWIRLCFSALNEQGRAGFVMANSAADARASEQELCRQFIESRAVDVMVAVGPNMFCTVTLPCTLLFFDKGKGRAPHSDAVLLAN